MKFWRSTNFKMCEDIANEIGNSCLAISTIRYRGIVIASSFNCPTRHCHCSSCLCIGLSLYVYVSIFLFPTNKELWHSEVIHCKRQDCIYKKGDDLNGSKEWRVGSSGECRRPITHGLQIAVIVMVIITGIMVIMMLGKSRIFQQVLQPMHAI